MIYKKYSLPVDKIESLSSLKDSRLEDFKINLRFFKISDGHIK